MTGLRQRWMRAALCALGIGLGVAAVVVVLAIPASTQQALLDQLGRDGNLLTVASGNTIDNQPVALPATSTGMVRRIDGVQRVSPVSYLTGRVMRRTSLIPVADTSGISVLSADPSLPSTLDLTLRAGRFLDAATARYPGVVLGSGAASALGVSVGSLAYLSDSDGHGGQYVTVLGVLAPVPLAPELDTSALVGTPYASAHLGFDGKPTRIYLRSDPDRVSDVRGVLHLRPRRRTRDRCRSGGRPTCSSRGLLPGRRCARWRSDWVPSRCSSAGWASRTSWSCRCSNAAARSACAGRSARAGRWSGCCSWPSRRCSACWAQWSARCSGWRSASATRRCGGSRRCCPGCRSPLVSPGRCSSVWWPACTRRCARPG